MDYKEIRQKLKEIGLTAQHMGTYAQDGQCIIYDDETDSEIETDVMGLLKANFGNVTIAETSHFHDGYGIYSFHDHNVHIKYSSYFSSYDSTEWREVIAEQKMVTVFSAKK